MSRQHRIIRPNWYAYLPCYTCGINPTIKVSTTVVHDPVHGAFAFRTVSLDEPHYAAFRWLADSTDPDSPSTLVEFRVDAVSESSTVLHVTETGFASLPGDSAERRAKYEANVEGWIAELDLARKHLESGKPVAAQ